MTLCFPGSLQRDGINAHIVLFRLFCICIKKRIIEIYTAFVLKQIQYDRIMLQLILRLQTSLDSAEYKNSIITFFKIETKKWEKYLRNKKILYRKE